MIPVTDLEMAANTTFTSIVNEIQLSDLNFSMKMTPFAAYITLKKTVQTDVNGFQVNPAPPLLFLLQKAQEDIQRLEVDNVKWKAAAERSAHEAQVLLDSLEETNQAVEDLANKNSSLHERIAKAEEENSNIHTIETA